MGRKRKTIDIEKLTDEVNYMLKHSTCDPNVRLGMCAVIETALHSTGNYGGFRYLGQDEVPNGQRPGVRYGDDRLILPYEKRFIDTDDSRRLYF